MGKRARDKSTIVESVELDEHHAVGVGAPALARELEGEPRLPDTACAGQRQETRPCEHGRELHELVLAAHERRGLDRQRAQGGPRAAELDQQLFELGMQHREALALQRCPVVVAVLGQQLAAVEGQSASVRLTGPLAPRVRRRVFEGVDVHLGLEP